jgi:hypothetical protein
MRTWSGFEDVIGFTAFMFPKLHEVAFCNMFMVDIHLLVIAVVIVLLKLHAVRTGGRE